MSRIWRENINGLKEFCGQYKCDSCGKIVYEVETVKSMDFCAKCYQETFGITEKDQKIADLESKLAESKEQLIDMNEKSNKIKKESYHIKQQLKDSEKFMKANGFKSWKEAQDALNGKFECIFDEKQELWKKIVAENAQLKQQLAEKEKEIERLKIYDEYRFEMPYPKVKILGKTLEDIQEIINKWLEQGGENKIDFAIEELEKVKEFIREFVGINDVKFICTTAITEQLDQQIKSLKGEIDGSTN